MYYQQLHILLSLLVSNITNFETQLREIFEKKKSSNKPFKDSLKYLPTDQGTSSAIDKPLVLNFEKT